MTRRAERLLVVAEKGAAGELLDGAADRRERILDLVRERRLSSAMPSSRSARRRRTSMRFWSEMSWKIAVAVRSVRSPSPSV